MRKRILAIILAAVMIIAFIPLTVTAATPAEMEAERLRVERKWDISIRFTEAWYIGRLDARGNVYNEELAIWGFNEIDNALTLIPTGLLRAVNVIYLFPDDGGSGSSLNLASGDVIFKTLGPSNNKASFRSVLTHEIGHCVSYLGKFGSTDNLERAFERLNGKYKYGSIQDFSELDDPDLRNTFISYYAKTNFSEDFAETFTWATLVANNASNISGLYHHRNPSETHRQKARLIDQWCRDVLGVPAFVSHHFLYSPLDGAAQWAIDQGLGKAIDAGLVPDGFIGNWTQHTNRLIAAEAIVKLIEAAYGKSYTLIAAEKGFDMTNRFADTNNVYATFLKASGISTGLDNINYGTTGSFSRIQMVTMLGRAAEKVFDVDMSVYPPGSAAFDDLPGWARNDPYVGWAATTGVTQGERNRIFNANGTLPNQQTGIFLYRALGEFSK